MSKPKRLTRSKKDQVLLGVCGGFAKYFEVDPVLVRAIFILGMFVTAILPLILAYVILAIIMPEEGSTNG